MDQTLYKDVGLKSCESAYNSSVIQYGIKETLFTEAYDQKHGIKTHYYEAFA